MEADFPELPVGFEPEISNASRALPRRPNRHASPPPITPLWKRNTAITENLQTAYSFARAYIAYVADMSGYEGKRVIEEMFGEEIVERRLHHWNTYQRMIMVDQTEQERLRRMNYEFTGMWFIPRFVYLFNRSTYTDVAELKGEGIPQAYKAFKEEHGENYTRILANYSKEDRIKPAMNPQARRKEFESAKHLIVNFVSVFPAY
jgi:hypothetical protein